MNKSDSDLMRKSLIDAGFSEAESIFYADIAVYNTCSVRDHAEQRAIAIITANNKILRKKDGISVLAGCMAQRIGPRLLNAHIADLVIGPYQSPEIGKLLTGYIRNNNLNSHLSQNTSAFCDRLPLHLSSLRKDLPWHEWVPVSHGCENFCSYCIVPYVRGKLISFSSVKVIEYLNILSSSGITEITLLGQNVNQYGMDNGDIPFHKLLEHAARIEGFQRINFLTSHPKDFSDEIIMTIKNHENISRSVHLPLQSGSNRILSLMNREYALNDYLLIIEKLHTILHSFALSTDLIVGYPGETAEEYRETLLAVEKIEFDEAFMFAYSPREGTPAFSLKESITTNEKKERLIQLIETQRKISEKKLQQRINSIEDIIIERLSKKSAESVMGRTYLNHPVVIPGTKDDIGKKLRIRIHGLKGSTLQGTRIA